jgi:hypothetical protein
VPYGRPRFADVFLALLSAARPDSNDPRAVLDFCAPDNLSRLVASAANEACAAYVHVLSDATRGQVNLVIGRAQTEVRSLQPVWAALDYEQRYGVWKGVARGIVAEEAQVGAQLGGVLGSLFGFEDVGRVLGGALGGLFVGHQHQEETRRASEQFQTAIQSWFQRLDVALQSQILPLLQRDEAEAALGHGHHLVSASTRSNRLIALVAAMAIVAGGAVAAALWLRSGGAAPGAGVPAAVSVSMVTSEPPSAAPPSAVPPEPATTLPATVNAPHAAARPAAPAPVSRTACLKACVAKCNDDASCERSCAATCPH